MSDIKTQCVGTTNDEGDGTWEPKCFHGGCQRLDREGECDGNDQALSEA